MSIQIGQIIDDKYRIIRELGRGSMGAVYEGENLYIHRRIAIKVLHPGVAGNASTVQRFEREAQAAGRIGSDHIVEVLDLGALPDGSYYMVMEFLEGISLRDRLRDRGRLTPQEVVPVAQQLLTGLEAAHQARIVHRDLKPDNVFLLASKAGQRDFVKILDFGVSKFSPLSTEDGLDLTKAGTVVGTPFYMSPEQAKGSKEIDARSDLYSVGIMLYECITGQKPFFAGTFNELIFKIVLEAPPPPEQFVPDLDPGFSRIVRKAMARTPEERYQRAAEMREALSVWLHAGQEELAATRLMEPRLPPPPPGRPAEPSAPSRAGPTDLSGAGHEPHEPEAVTRVVERVPPPPPMPQHMLATDPPAAPGAGPTLRSGQRTAAVAAVVAVVAVTAGGIAAVVVTSEPRGDDTESATMAPDDDSAAPPARTDDQPAGAEPEPMSPEGEEQALEPSAPDGGVAEPDDEPVSDGPPKVSPPPSKIDSPPATSKTRQAPPPRGAPTSADPGEGHERQTSQPGRAIATEL